MKTLPITPQTKDLLQALYGILCQARGFGYLEARVVKHIKSKFEAEAKVTKVHEDGIASVRFQIQLSGSDYQAIDLEDPEFEIVQRVFQQKTDWNGFQAELACDIEDLLKHAAASE